MYQLACEKNDFYPSAFFWLKGDDVTIKGRLEKNELKIDTVINSPFYYYTENIINKYLELKENNTEESVINSFLLKHIKENIDHSFSNELVGKFINNNIESPESLRELHTLIKDQNDDIKNHLLSRHEDLGKLISVESVDFSKYQFSIPSGNLTQISLNEDSLYLLDFWSTYCAPCIEEHQLIKDEIRYLSDNKIKVIGMSSDHLQSKWTKLLAKKKYPWDNYREEAKSPLGTDVGITINPTYILINHKGEILDRSITFVKSMEFIKNMNEN